MEREWLMAAAIALSVAGCSHKVYCWRNTEASPPHCFEDRDHCDVDLLVRSEAATLEQIRSGQPAPVCQEEAR